MVANKNETAEQKLLKMIETSSGSPAAANQSARKNSKKFGLLGLLQLTNKVLILLVVLAVFLIAWQIKEGLNLLAKGYAGSNNNVAIKSSAGPESLIPVVRPVSDYLAMIQVRNIFQPYEKEESATIETVNRANRNIKNMVSGFKLVGISWLDHVDTASVIIEDTEKGETYFKAKGQKIGDIIVKTIYADSALLGYEDEEIMITYDKSQM